MSAYRCPACGDESASPPAEVFCVRCATDDYAITERRLKVRLEGDEVWDALHQQFVTSQDGPDPSKCGSPGHAEPETAQPSPNPNQRGPA
jgi:hypothetical protein